jgi:hypothetical protein
MDAKRCAESHVPRHLCKFWVPFNVRALVTNETARASLLRAPAVGRATIASVERALARLGLRFGMSWSDVERWETEFRV